MILKENTQKTSSNSDPKTKSALLDKYEADAKKEVETGANGTQDYIIKKGENKGKKANVK